MIPQFPEFKPIEIEDRAELENFIKDFPPYSDFEFVSLFCWDVEGKRQISKFKGNLVAKLTSDVSGKEFLSFIGSNHIPDSVDVLLGYANKININPALKMVPQSVVQGLESRKSSIKIIPDRDNFDYVYNLNDLRDLAGPKYANVRNSLNGFLKKYDGQYQVKLIDIGTEDNKKYLFKVWSEWVEVKESYSDREVQAMQRLLDIASHLKIISIMIFIGDKPIAFSINQNNGRGFATAHFAKVDYNYSGVFPLLWKETAKCLINEGCNFLNLEEDLGMPGLRRSKLLYRPSYFLEKYTVEQEGFTKPLASDTIIINMNTVLSKLHDRKLLIFTLTFFVVLSVWWLTIYSRGLMEGGENDAFAFIYPLVSLWGGVAGLLIAQHWGGYKSILGRAFGAFALGLLGQAFGQLMYQLTYLISKEVVPYPSVGDFGFFSTAIFYTYGLIYLMIAIGAKPSLKTYKGRVSAIVIPILGAVFSYMVFLKGYEFDWSMPIVIVLDLVSPILDGIYLSLVLLTFFLVRNMLGGVMKIPVLLLLVALVAEAVSDFTFLYLYSHYEHLIYPAAFNDYMYLVTYTLMAVALVRLGSAFEKISDA